MRGARTALVSACASTGFRAARITQMLNETDGAVTLERMREIQLDYRSNSFEWLGRPLLRAVPVVAHAPSQNACIHAY